MGAEPGLNLWDSLHTFGLVIFALTVGINAAGLMIDAVLFSQGWPTVSAFASRNPWAAALIIALNGAGLLGLAIHFSNGKAG